MIRSGTLCLLAVLGADGYQEKPFLTPEEAKDARRGLRPEIREQSDEELLKILVSDPTGAAVREMGIRYRTYDAEERRHLLAEFVAEAETLELDDLRRYLFRGNRIFFPDEYLDLLRRFLLKPPLDSGEFAIAGNLASEAGRGTDYGEAGAQLMLDVHEMIQNEGERTGRNPIQHNPNDYYLAFGACGAAGIDALQQIGWEGNDAAALALACIGTERAAQLLADTYMQRLRDIELLGSLVQLYAWRKYPVLQEPIQEGLSMLIEETEAVGSLGDLIHFAGRTEDPYFVPFLQRAKKRIPELQAKDPYMPEDPSSVAQFQKHISDLPGKIDAAIAKIEVAQQETEEAGVE